VIFENEMSVCVQENEIVFIGFLPLSQQNFGSLSPGFWRQIYPILSGNLIVCYGKLPPFTGNH
jgi:hypothetical protein